jgi:hypothetical protein
MKFALSFLFWIYFTDNSIVHESSPTFLHALGFPTASSELPRLLSIDILMLLMYYLCNTRFSAEVGILKNGQN